MTSAVLCDKIQGVAISHKERENKVMKNELTFKSVYGVETKVMFYKGLYQNNNNLYVGAYFVDEDGYEEPFCNITVNLRDALSKNMAYIDTNNADKHLLKAMVDADMMFSTGFHQSSGFCTYPIFFFPDEILNDIPDLEIRKKA